MKSKKAYVGTRSSDKGGEVYVVQSVANESRGSIDILNPRFDLCNHSPTGFEWGYRGSGPAQLALAILADAVGEKFALQHHQAFKEEFIAPLQDDEWSIQATDVRSWALNVRKEARSKSPHGQIWGSW